MKSNSKVADLAGPGISTYSEVEKILPNDYSPLQTPIKRMKALYMIKDYIEKGLAEALNLQLVQVPLIVSKDSGVNGLVTERLNSMTLSPQIRYALALPVCVPGTTAK